MSERRSALAWPPARLGTALEALARQSGLEPRPGHVTSAPASEIALQQDALGAWIEAAALQLGVEASRHDVPPTDTARFVLNAGPALYRLPGDGAPTFLAVLRCRRHTVLALGPELAVHRLQLSEVISWLSEPVDARLSRPIDTLLAEAGVPDQEHARARDAFLRSFAGMIRGGACWRLRLAPGASLWRHAGQARLGRLLSGLIATYAAHDLLLILSWWIVGTVAIDGRIDQGRLVAWALLLFTSVPFQVLAMWLQGRLGITVGGVLKRQLLRGALKLEPDEVRHQGVGQHLAVVIESEAIELLALTGGLLSLAAAVTLVVTGVILAMIAAWLHLLLLLLTVAALVLVGARYLARRREWTEARLRITHDLVEGMIGHRTRILQRGRARWHEGEDDALAAYLEHSRRLDRVSGILLSVIPRGWFLVGLVALVPSFLSAGASPGVLAVTLGGLILGATALARLTEGLLHLAGVAIAWKQVGQLERAARHPEIAGSPDVAYKMTPAEMPPTPEPLVVARDVSFRYPGRARSVLHDCRLEIRPGEAIVMGGPSGGGKSTLVSLLTGLRVPDSGLLLVDGLDLPTLGSNGWRRRIAAAPQFHENHIFTETLAFNVLMGARWPPEPRDLEEAERVCRGLGLGDLLDRMPAGLFQMVGETGWQLSHGERSRLYIARALLQDADLVIFDESFGQIDPESLRDCLRYVSDRARTLLVITHS